MTKIIFRKICDLQKNFSAKTETATKKPESLDFIKPVQRRRLEFFFKIIIISSIISGKGISPISSFSVLHVKNIHLHIVIAFKGRKEKRRT